MPDSCLPTVLLIGNFLSAHGGSRNVCEELALQLQARIGIWDRL